MNIKSFIFLITCSFILSACSGSNTYNPELSAELVDEYCYETKFKGDHEGYDKMINSLSQSTFAEIIGQLHGIVIEAQKQLESIKTLNTLTQQKTAYAEFNDGVMLYNFEELNGLIGDAMSRNLLNESNTKAYNKVRQIIENEIVPLDESIRNRVR